MTPVDCTCDAGERDGGICPDCIGWGWYLDTSCEAAHGAAIDRMVAECNEAMREWN